MRCFEWRHSCGSCEHHFARPGADLSFSYGTFLGVSPTPEAVVLEATIDPAYAEIQILVTEDGRGGGIPGMTFGQLVRQVAGSVFDHDSADAPFSFTGLHYCPKCSVLTTGVTETRNPWPVDPVPATHSRWDALTPAAKVTEVRQALDAAFH